MKMLELMEKRHSVRQYTKRIIEESKRKELDRMIHEINREAGLHFQILYDEPRCFRGIKAHYGKFRGVTNYIALVGKKSPKLYETCGYYGEMLVLKAQELGLNTCWVAVSHGKSRASILDKEKEVCIIALGYGESQGTAHKSKEFTDVCRITNLKEEKLKDWKQNIPEWFLNGVRAALLAPTAMNQQKFVIEYDGSCARFEAGRGAFTKLDLGIVEYHFETVAEETQQNI